MHLGFKQIYQKYTTVYFDEGRDGGGLRVFCQREVLHLSLSRNVHYLKLLYHFFIGFLSLPFSLRIVDLSPSLVFTNFDPFPPVVY